VANGWHLDQRHLNSLLELSFHLNVAAAFHFLLYTVLKLGYFEILHCLLNLPSLVK
jgi:hypothetical protein